MLSSFEKRRQHIRVRQYRIILGKYVHIVKEKSHFHHGANSGDAKEG